MEFNKDGWGWVVNIKRPAFPDAKPGDKVMVRKKVIQLAPDFRANAYLVDRIAGKPTESVEVDVAEESPLIEAFGQAVERVYGRSEEED